MTQKENSIEMTFFGPPGLIKKVTKTKYESFPDGNVFPGISFGRYRLKTIEDSNSEKMRVSIFSSEGEFTLEGWAPPNAFTAAKFAAENEGGLKSYGGGIKLAGILLTLTKKKGDIRYQIFLYR